MPIDAFIPCFYCDGLVDLRLVHYVRVKGWEKIRRNEGGAHGIIRKEDVPGVAAHAGCVNEERERRRRAAQHPFHTRSRNDSIRVNKPCWFGCGEPVLSGDAQKYRRVEGWDEPRQAGGANKVVCRDVIDGACHEACLRDTRRNQASLFE